MAVPKPRTIQKAPGTNTLELTQRVDALLDQIESGLPGGMKLNRDVFRQAAFIGRSVDNVMGIARDAFSDGRISAVSITDNPGGNPSLSPDVIGNEIFKLGMDAIVHMTCRDMNRSGLESRSLQLDLLGMKNILALSGDYSGNGFGGIGAPVFDLD